MIKIELEFSFLQIFFKWREKLNIFVCCVLTA